MIAKCEDSQRFLVSQICQLATGKWKKANLVFKWRYFLKWYKIDGNVPDIKFFIKVNYITTAAPFSSPFTLCVIPRIFLLAPRKSTKFSFTLPFTNFILDFLSFSSTNFLVLQSECNSSEGDIFPLVFPNKYFVSFFSHSGGVLRFFSFLCHVLGIRRVGFINC